MQEQGGRGVADAEIPRMDQSQRPGWLQRLDAAKAYSPGSTLRSRGLLEGAYGDG